MARNLIVGVDYGTTYSGVSYVWSDASSIKDIQIIEQWSGGARSDNRSSKKVPSRICYDYPITWGFNIEPGSLAYSWTKLLLDRRADTTNFDDHRLREIFSSGLLQTPPGKSPEDVVTDYLTQLYKHVMEFLAKKFSEGVLRATAIKFWFTRPALWSLQAQYATRDAAMKAGFGSRPGDEIYLIKEPEAAVIACLNDLIKDSPNSLVQVGHGILICDCGGGTVDLASYRIKKAYPRLELEQACVTEGGKCGSTTIDRAFHELLRGRFGRKFDDVPRANKAIGSRLMREFEDAKRDFGSTRFERSYRFLLKMENVPDSAYYEDRDIKLSREDMKSLFDPVVQKVKQLVQQQIDDAKRESSLTINTIILAGGMGENIYLYNELKSWCPSSVYLLSPHNAWEAVCCGAALRGLEGPVVRKIKAERYYGIEIQREFRAGIDSESDAYQDEFDGKKKVNGYMSWTYEKGEDIYPETVRRNTFWWSYTEGGTKTRKVDLFESNMAIAPEKCSHHSVKRDGDIVVDFTNVDLSKFEYKYKSLSLTKVYKVDFELESSLSDNLGYLHFRLVIQGKEAGKATIKFSSD